MSSVPNLLTNWISLLGSALGIPKKALSNPNFVFSFLIIMTISSAGVWAPRAFDMNLYSVCHAPEVTFDSQEPSENLGSLSNSENDKLKAELINQAMRDSCDHISSGPSVLFQGFSVFMFSLGLLGGIAFEFFVSQKNKPNDLDGISDNENNIQRMNEFAGFFVWVIAFILSSYGLKEPTTTSLQSLIGGFLAISLWVCINHNKTEFMQPDPKPENLEAGGNKDKVVLDGEGLS